MKTKFSKPPLSIADQVELIKRRGMEVPDEALARESLQHISYYRLRAYWLPFETNAAQTGDHNFKAGTCFNDILALYTFDRKLRLLVMDALERVEVSLRGSWAHYLALKYGSHGYLDPSLYYRADHYAVAMTQLIEEINRSKDTFVVHYKEKYGDPPQPPIWMTAEIISFGQLSKWLANLKHRQDRQRIAKPYGIDEKILISISHHLTYIRNICAHHGRLWNKQFIVTMTMPSAPLHLKVSMHPGSSRNLYNTLTALSYLIKLISPSTMWIDQFIELIDDFALVDKSEMGFPSNWKYRPVWKTDH